MNIKENEIKKFIVNYLEKKGKISKDIDIDNLKYIETGYIDSIGIVKFIIELEEKFDIQILEEDILSEEFKTVKGLVNIINKKCKILS